MRENEMGEDGMECYGMGEDGRGWDMGWGPM